MKNLLFVLACAVLASCGSRGGAIIASTGEHINGPVKTITEHYVDGNAAGKGTNENSMEFDKDGKQIRGTMLTEEGSYKTTITYYFSIPGKLEKATITGSGPGELATRRFNYDDKGRIASIVDEVTGEHPMSIKTEREYDGKGHLVAEKLYDENGALSQRMSVEYDSKGNVSKTKLQMEGGPSTTMETTYTYGNYDKHNNWQTGTISFSGGSATTVKREITYY